MDWKPHAISLAVGLLVGGLYAFLNTKSPAPPIIALLGLLGMLAGESAVSWARSHISFTEAAKQCLEEKTFVSKPSETDGKSSA